MKRDISFKQSFIIIFTTAVSLIVSIVYFKLSAVFALLAGTLLSVFFSLRNGYEVKEVKDFIYEGIKRASPVMINMLLIGIIIGVWLCSGVIPATVVLGLKTISPDTFLFSAFIICTILSVILGTGIGTISTAGIALIMVSRSLSIPDYITAGAIISGAYVGCRTSVMSPITILTANSTETELRSMIKYTLSTLIPSVILCLIIYYFLGLKIYSAGDSSKISSFISLINNSYNINMWLLLPPVLIIILSFLKVSISKSLCAGLLSSAVLGLIFQDISLLEILKSSVFGYRSNLNPELSNIFKGGGIRSMIELLEILITASAFSGLLSGTRILHSLLGNTVQKLSSGRQLVLYTLMLSTMTAIFGCNQIVSIIIPSQFLLSSYKRFGIPKLVLARAISDSGVMISPIIPWNVCAIVPAAIMGVTVIQFAPYSFLCFIMPLINTLFTYISPYKLESHASVN